MIKFLNSMTNGKARMLRTPFILEVIQSMFLGQPFFVILMVLLELTNPLEHPGTPLNFTKLTALAFWLAASLALLFLFSRSVLVREHSAAYSISAEGRIALGEHLRKLSMGFYNRRDPGEVTSLLLQDYANIEQMISMKILSAISAVALPLVFIVFLFPFDWRMTLICLIPFPLAGGAAVLTGIVVTHTGGKHIKAKNEAAARMLEYLNGIRNIKAFNLSGEKFSRLRTSFKELKRYSLRNEVLPGPLVITGIWILYAGIALIMIAGTAFFINGTLSLRNFLVFLIIGSKIFDPLVKAMTGFIETAYYTISVRRIRKIYDIKPLPVSENPSVPESCDIEFSDVTFSYKDTEVLKNVSFQCRENTVTALVGPSGSGKSTLTRLIARFWDADSGTIKIGGVQLSDMSPVELLSRISMVFQDVYLFNDTIINNIRMGRADATDEDVYKAAQKARCHEFISALPDGYQTTVGEGGSTMSGGEKQRISIARAILKNAPIILLDEATASLDPENELYIQQAIGELVTGRTLVIIAHRLGTIKNADQIIVLDEGKIAGSGTHLELISDKEGLYYNMWAEQTRAHSWKVQ